MKHRLLLGLLILLYTIHYPLSAFAADNITFTASAPLQVVADRPFQLTYTVNAKAKNLRQPDWAPFDVLAGPYTSQSQSTSFVNGKMSSSFTLTYTFTLITSQEGSFTIGPATITADGDEYRSNGLKITVLPADKQPTNPSGSTSGHSAQGNPSAGSASDQDCFIRTLVSKTTVTEQEPIYLCYKLYFTNVDIAQFTNNTRIPEFTGFLKQELENGEIQTELEHYEGRNYQTAVLYKTVLYPQRSGDIKIDPASFEAVLRVQTRQQVRSIFDDFFGSYTNVNHTLTAPGTTIHVKPLPAGKPTDFSGAVGKFNLSCSLSPESGSLKVNEALTIKMNISGSGNMKLIKTPAIDWPEGFEPYDPKVTNNFKTTTSGTSGTKSIEYLAIPRAAGEYLIPAVHFSYFDTSTGQYKTLSTPEYTLHITRDGQAVAESESSNNPPSTIHHPQTLKEDIKHLGSDIRYIHTQESSSNHHKLTSKLSVNKAVWCYILVFVGALIVFLIAHHIQRENANVAHVRYKKANKVAQKRLKAAKTALTASNYSAFYEEIEKALWQYLSDRLGISTAELSKDNIVAILRSKAVSEELIKEVDAVLTTTQMARYTASMSSNPQADAETLYNQTVTLINNLENQKI